MCVTSCFVFSRPFYPYYSDPFCFVAKNDDTIVGAISGATFFAEIYIDELVVKEAYRGKGIGTELIDTVLECCT